MNNSLVVVEISGKNVPRFINSLYKRGIIFYNLSVLEHNAQITISYSDYLLIKKIPTIYQITLVKYSGFLKIVNFLKIYRQFISILILGFCFLLFLTHIIFDVEVVHVKEDVRSLVLEELARYDIKRFSFIKSFSEGEKIASDILKNNRSIIEWLSIERVGTKYIVKVTERKKVNDEETVVFRDVIAKKKGMIISISASQGEVLKKVNDYVEAGEVLISGAIKNKDVIKDYVHATGQVFAETWYTVHVEVPSFYLEEEKTENTKKSLRLNFLSLNINLFSSFTYFKEVSIFSLKHSFLPISITFSTHNEVLRNEALYTWDQALLKAHEIARIKLLESLGKEDSIIEEKSLKKYEEDSKIIVDIFFRVKEDITDYVEIVPLNDGDM